MAGNCASRMMLSNRGSVLSNHRALHVHVMAGMNRFRRWFHGQLCMFDMLLFAFNL